MSSAITAADANRQFSALLRRVREGRTIVITSHGRPVARMVPVTHADPIDRSARADLFTRLGRARIRKIGTWTRDELYERSR